MKLYLYRHGETNWNKQGFIQGQTDIHLNEEGYKQAGELAAQLRDQNIKVCKIYTSPQVRARETAMKVGEHLGVPCIDKDGLKEINFGLWEGLTWDEVKSRYPQEYKRWFENRRYQAPPQGESYQDLLVRVISSLKEIINSNQDDVLIIAHSAVIMTLNSWLNNTSFDEMVKRYKTKNVAGMVMESSQILNKDI